MLIIIIIIINTKIVKGIYGFPIGISSFGIEDADDVTAEDFDDKSVDDDNSDIVDNIDDNRNCSMNNFDIYDDAWMKLYEIEIWGKEKWKI